MPSLHSLSPPLILSLLFLAAHSQNPDPSSCTLRLLPLLPCMPFVQGMTSNVLQQCCDGLDQLYSVQPQCLCLILNNTALVTSFPINATLALRLPSLCSLLVDGNSCSGKLVSPGSPTSQISFGTNTSTSPDLNNSTPAATPAVAIGPRPSSLGFAFDKSEGMKLKATYGFKVTAFAAAICVVML